MHKKKIVYIIEAAEGGTLTYLDMLLMNINLDRFEPTVIISFKRSPVAEMRAKEWKKRGVQVIKLNMHRSINIIRDSYHFLKIFLILKKQSFDILHTISSKAGFLGGWAGNLCSIPKRIYSPHGLAHLNKRLKLPKLLYFYLDWLTCKAYHKLLTIAQSENDALINKKIVKEDAIHTILNVVDSKRFCPGKKKPEVIEQWFGRTDVKVVGWVGRLVHQKQPIDFLKIANEICRKDSNIHFIMIGWGTLKSQVTSGIEKLNLADRVKFIGPQDDMRQLYRNMDVLVNTSYWEGRPYTLLEAMACGLPVVATSIPAHREVIISGNNGALFEFNDCSSCADKLLEILGDNKKYAAIQKNGRAYILSCDSLEQWVEEKEKLYFM